MTDTSTQIVEQHLFRTIDELMLEVAENQHSELPGECDVILEKISTLLIVLREIKDNDSNTRNTDS